MIRLGCKVHPLGDNHIANAVLEIEAVDLLFFN